MAVTLICVTLFVCMFIVLLRAQHLQFTKYSQTFFQRAGNLVKVLSSLAPKKNALQNIHVELLDRYGSLAISTTSA